MTRINVVPVDELTKEHAFGEYKEILRPISKVRKALLKFPNKWSFHKNYKNIPPDYVLGKSHETFFFDKLQYIAERYQQLCEWREHHGYKYTKLSVDEILDGLPDFVLNNYIPTDNALLLNRQRIHDRLSGIKD